MPQDDFGGEFGIGVAEEKGVHRSFGQNQARCLYLHAIEWVTNDSRRRANGHTQRLEVVYQAASPVFWPVPQKLRGLLPERLIVRAMFVFGSSYRLNTLLPALYRLIL